MAIIVHTEGKIKPATIGGKVADFPDIDGEVQTDQIANEAVTPAKLEADSGQNKIDMRARIGAAPLDSPAFTGTPTASTPVAAEGVATKKYVDDKSGTVADGSVTPAKLDADNKTKKDAFLTRLNALRNDLNNIATLSIENQRAALIALGSLIDGPRPQPSAAYSGRTWIDDHNDRAYVCRNRQVFSDARVGAFQDDTQVAREGIEIVERLVDLEPPASNVDYGYTSNDNKWWVGTSIGGTLEWRETTPVAALRARLSIKPNWTAVWLGKHQWDYNALTQIPQDVLPANTDYFFYNSRTVTIRKFKRSSYTAAGTPLDHWQWESLKAVAAEIDIIEARDGNLPALSSDGSDDRKIAVANDGLHFVKLIPEASTLATVGAWATYVFANASPNIRRYIGVHSADPDISSSTIGDFFYNPTNRKFRILYDSDGWAFFASHWEDLSDENVAWPTRFVGHHATRAEAIAYAASSGIKTGETFVAYTGALVETASMFVEGVSARFSRHWRFLPLNESTGRALIYLDDVFSMPGGNAVDIETGNTGRNYKTVYGLDHTVRISKVKVAASENHAQGSEDWRLTLLKGTAPNSSDESTIHVSSVLWPVNIGQRQHDQFTAQTLTTTEHTFDIPDIIVKRGEYLVVQLGRVSTLSSRSRVRVVRDLTSHHSFNALRYVGSGTDDLDSGVVANYGVDNVEWSDAGLWIEIEYAIEYDAEAAIATNTDDYLTALAFTVDAGVVKAKATRHGGGEVDATGAALLASKASVTTLAGKTKTSSDIATIADQRATARYTNAEKNKLRDAAPLANPALTGTPTAPTPASTGGNTQIATKKYVDDSGYTESEIKSLITSTELSALSGAVTNDQIPDVIMRDSELTLDAIRGLLGLSAQEVTDLLTGASISGQVLSYTKNDGTVITLTIPEGTAVADGVVASGVFSSDGRTLTLTLSDGTPIVIPVPARPTPTARGVHWGRVTFGAKADNITEILVASEFGYTPASDTPTGMAKVGDTITLPIDPPSDEIIGLWFVGSENGTDEVMSRLLLWGSIHRTANWNSEDIFFSDGKVIRVIMSRNTTTGVLLLTFQQIDGAIVATQTIDIYPVVTSGGSGQKTVIIADDPVNRVAPTADNENNLLLRNNNLFRQSVHHGKDKSVTWGDITPTNLPGYKGSYDSVSDLPLITIVNDIRFVRRGGHFVKATNTTGNYVDFVPLTFIGSWTREADATRHAMAIGDIAGFISNTGPNTTQMFPNIVTAYTAPENETRLWVRIDGDVLEAVARNYFGFTLGAVGGGESRRLSLVRPNGVTDVITDLGVQVVFHTTRATYNTAAVDDGKLHIVTAV